MARKYKFAISGINKRTGKRELFVANTRSDIKRNVKPKLKNMSIRKGTFTVRKNRR